MTAGIPAGPGLIGGGGMTVPASVAAEAHALARALPGRDDRAAAGGPNATGSGVPRLRQGVIDTVNTDGTVDVILGDDGVVLTGIQVLAGVRVAAAAAVWAVHQPPMPPIVLGMVGLGPLGRLTKGRLESNTGSTSGTNELTVVTADDPITPVASNRIIRVTATWRAVTGTSGDIYELRIKRGSTKVQGQNKRLGVSSLGHAGGTMQVDDESPSVTAHTYSLVIARVSGAGTALVEAASDAPAEILVEDAGPVPA